MLPSDLPGHPLPPPFSVKLTHPYMYNGAPLFAALRKTCFTSTHVLRLECNQVATSMQMLQRLFDEPAVEPALASESESLVTEKIRTLSLGVHKELYIRKVPLWNIFDALAQKRIGDKPAFPGLQTLIISELPYHIRWLESGIPLIAAHYIPPALIGCLKERRDLGYPVASLQIPLRYRIPSIEDGLEGLVYLEYF